MSKTTIKPKYSIGQDVIVLNQDDLSVKHFTIGGIMINDDGMFYTDGVNLGSKHCYLEVNVFKNQSEAVKRAMELIDDRVNDYRKELIKKLSGE